VKKFLAKLRKYRAFWPADVLSQPVNIKSATALHNTASINFCSGSLTEA